MSPYLDAGFLLTVLVKTNGTQKARETLLEVEAPCKVTRLHELQVRTFIRQIGLSTMESENTSIEARQLWQWYTDEGVFEMVELDWSSALLKATRLVETLSSSPAAPLLILHPVLASTSGASQFLSFDPRSRRIADMLGLKVLPEQI